MERLAVTIISIIGLSAVFGLIVLATNKPEPQSDPENRAIISYCDRKVDALQDSLEERLGLLEHRLDDMETLK